MLRIIFILLAFVCLFCDVQAQNIAAHWSFVIDGQRDTDVKDLVVDDQGNTYVAFDYSGSLSVTGLKTKIPPAPHVHTGLLKLSPQGKPLWVQVVRSAFDNRVNAVEIAPNGDVLIAGFADGLVRFASGKDTIRLGREKGKEEYHHPQGLYLARYSPEGKCRWVHHMPVKGFGQSCDIAVNSKDEVYYAFYYYGDMANAYGLPLRKYDNNLCVVQKLDGKDARVLETRTMDMSHLGSYVIHFNLKTDEQDNLYEFGIFRKFLSLEDGDSLLNDGYYDGADAFLLKYDAQGKRSWARQIGGQNYQLIKDLVVEPSGELHLTGQFTYECVFSDGVIPIQKTKVESHGGSHFFYIRLDAEGELLQAEYVKSQAGRYINGMSIALGPDSSILCLANTTDTLNIQEKQFIPQLGNDQTWLSQWNTGKLADLGFPARAPKGFMLSRVIDSNKNHFAASAIYHGDDASVELESGKVALSNREYGRNTVVWGGLMRPHVELDSMMPLASVVQAERRLRQLVEVEKIQSLLVCAQSREEETMGLWYPVLQSDTGRAAWLGEHPCGLRLEVQQAKVYPNPTIGSLSLELRGMQGLVNVDIFSEAGKLLHSRVIEGLEGEQTLFFDLSAVAAGMYFLRVRANGFEKALRVVKVEH